MNVQKITADIQKSYPGRVWDLLKSSPYFWSQGDAIYKKNKEIWNRGS